MRRLSGVVTILLVVACAVAVVLASVVIGLVITLFGFNSRLEQAYEGAERAHVRRRRAETALRDSGLSPEEQAQAADARRAEVNALIKENANLRSKLEYFEKNDGGRD